MDISDGTLSHRDNQEQCVLAGKSVGMAVYSRSDFVGKPASTRLALFQGSANSDYPISYPCYV
jgi:hypothetical protein